MINTLTTISDIHTLHVFIAFILKTNAKKVSMKLNATTTAKLSPIDKTNLSNGCSFLNNIILKIKPGTNMTKKTPTIFEINSIC